MVSFLIIFYIVNYYFVSSLIGTI